MITLEHQLSLLKISLKDIFGEDVLTHIDNYDIEKNDPFMKHFKIIWADCGDNISIHYTGTGSTHTDVTKSGKRDFMGLLGHGLTSIKRFYNQNYDD